jgi:hypothetical protein
VEGRLAVEGALRRWIRRAPARSIPTTAITMIAAADSTQVTLNANALTERRTPRRRSWPKEDVADQARPPGRATGIALLTKAKEIIEPRLCRARLAAQGRDQPSGSVNSVRCARVTTSANGGPPAEEAVARQWMRSRRSAQADRSRLAARLIASRSQCSGSPEAIRWSPPSTVLTTAMNVSTASSGVNRFTLSIPADSAESPVTKRWEEPER